MSLDGLKAYEGEFDELVKNLPLWQLPVRPILTALHCTVDGLFNGSRHNDDHPPRPEAGAAAGARLSYLVPHLLRCESEPTGLHAADALRAVHEADPNGVMRAVLLSYGHFCEIMPEAHKGYYAVTGGREGGSRLAHASPAFAEHEALDILLTELSLSFVAAPAPRHRDRFDHQAGLAPRFDLGLKMHTLKLFFEHYLAHLAEPPILTDDGYRAAVGVSREEFERFRAGLFAYADYCKGMADAMERRLRREGFSEALWNELLEWLSVNWKETFFVGVLKGLTGLELLALERLLGLFTVDFRRGHRSGRHAGDGFLPPLARLEGAYLFNPDLLKLFLPARNVLYTLNRTDKKRYDDAVSQHLEPQLLRAAVELFAGFEGLRVVLNHDWGAGEIDLLVYSPPENAALHVQAKAAIPPQGARMLQTVEGRMLEGLDQLRRLSELGPERRDEVLSQALGQRASGTTVIDVLLSRSCIGTERVWSQLGDVIPLNISLLRDVLGKARAEGATLALRSFPERARQATDALLQAARPQFVEKEILAGATTIRMPLLEYDADRVREEQRRIWERE